MRPIRCFTRAMSIATILLASAACTPDPELYPDCSVYPGPDGRIIDCEAMDRCIEDDPDKLWACCNCDRTRYCGVDLTCNAGPLPLPQSIHLGPRPYYLVDDMDPSELKTTLAGCSSGPFYKRDFSIGHRGAPMQFPEHTRESYMAAARMGAGVIECDVTFTADRELVCRESQCDLHATTNILAIPELAAKCTEPFTPADPVGGTPASAQCCTSDITLAEFKSLCGKMDASNPDASTVEEYMGGTADWRTDLYATCGTLLSHAESIELFEDVNVKMAPKLNTPMVPMPFEGDYTQEMYAQQLVDEYNAASVVGVSIFPQSENLDDFDHWLNYDPAFAMQGVYLDFRFQEPSFDPAEPSTWSPTMDELMASGVRIIAPPIWVLVELDSANQIVPTAYSREANIAGLDIITWSLERSGPLQNGGGFYYQSIEPAIERDGDMLKLLHVLAQDVNIRGIFSDWPATTTYYANCMDLD